MNKKMFLLFLLAIGSFSKVGAMESYNGRFHKKNSLTSTIKGYLFETPFLPKSKDLNIFEEEDNSIKSQLNKNYGKLARDVFLSLLAIYVIPKTVAKFKQLKAEKAESGKGAIKFAWNNKLESLKLSLGGILSLFTGIRLAGTSYSVIRKLLGIEALEIDAQKLKQQINVVEGQIFHSQRQYKANTSTAFGTPQKRNESL